VVRNDINLEYDQESGDYYIVWEPVILSAGKTERQALEELRGAAHLGVDTLIDLKLKKIKKED
jgi:predicted RNase H-like HicB family nuclease